MTKHEELIEILLAAGFNSGWVLSGTDLILWEHEENPPKPLTKPKTIL